MNTFFMIIATLVAIEVVVDSVAYAFVPAFRNRLNYRVRRVLSR